VFYDITSLALGVLRELPCVALRLSEARVRTLCSHLPVGAGEAVMLKNHRRHSNTGPTLLGSFGAL